MENKKVLFVCQYFYPEKISSGVLPYELARELTNDSYDVTALVGYPKEYVSNDNFCTKNEIYENISIKRISYIQANRKKTIGRIINMISFSIAVFFHPKIFKNCDVYITFTNPPLLPLIVAFFKKIFKKEFIVVIYDLYPDSPIKLGYLNENSLIAKCFNLLNMYVFKNAKKVIAVSSEMKEYLMENKNLSSDKVEVIHNWYADIYSDSLYNVQNPLKILYGGNMGIAQDMQTIIETALFLKDDNRFKFIFVGHGSKKNYIENYIAEYNLKNCIVYDFLGKEKYDLLLESCQLAILSLNKNISGLGSPSKYYGYLALKKPVIAIVPKNTDIYTDIINDFIGIHVNSGESNLLKDKLINLADNPNQLIKMSENAYHIFKEKYTLNKSAKKYKKILEE